MPVVGVVGRVNEAGRLTSVGITCALCHSMVDNSFAPGIGRRLDGWANVDLNVGAIVALSPALDPALKDEFNAWGPGKYDPRHHVFDGTRIIPINSPSLPVVIPPIYGLQRVGLRDVHRRRLYFLLEQLRGRVTDGRPWDIPRPSDWRQHRPKARLVTPKLPALLFYQLTLKTPEPPAGSFDRAAASGGEQCFRTRHGAARVTAARPLLTYYEVLVCRFCMSPSK